MDGRNPRREAGSPLETWYRRTSTDIQAAKDAVEAQARKVWEQTFRPEPTAAPAESMVFHRLPDVPDARERSPIRP